MQCVILAAGEGVRMRPLTLNTPKPLLKVAGKTLLDYLLNGLPKEITELIIVIGYLGDKIKNYLGEEFLGKKVIYVHQRQKLGTFDALEHCESYLNKGNFLMLYADDFHSPLNFKRLLKTGGLGVLLAEVPNPERFGVAVMNPDGTIKEIEEKPKNPKSNLVSCGPAVLNRKILNFPPPKHHTGEYFLPDSINLMIKAGSTFYGVKSDWWIPIGYPEDLKKAEKFLSKVIK